jgi:FixJ family two-component response regulator
MTVRSFASAEDYLDAEACQPGCLILDVRLPGLSGLELYAELRRRGLAHPAVFITGFDDPRLRDEALAAGAVAFLQKPFQEEALLDAVARALGRCGRRTS